MSWNTRDSRGPIATRLSGVSTPAALHEFLGELASKPGTRWTRTQIMFYLPEAMQGLAEEYFVGERLVMPDRRPIQLTAPDPALIDRAIEALRARSAFESEEGEDEHVDVRPLDALSVDPPVDEHDIIGHVLAAIREEAQVVDRESPKRYRLSAGRCIGPQGEYFVYVFSWSSEPEIFLPGELRVGDRTVTARVGRQAEGERRFELLSEEFLGPHIERAVFKVDPTFLLRAAFETLRTRRDVFATHKLARSLFSPPDALTSTPDVASGAALNSHQRQAIGVAVAAERSYVWGPPGTGKTTSLGHLIRELTDAGKRVLVLSPYNIAVDEAVLSAQSRGQWHPEQLVRVGRISEAVRKTGIDLDTLLERRAEKSGLLNQVRALFAKLVAESGEPDRPAPATVRKCLEELGTILMNGRRDRENMKDLARLLRVIRQSFRAPEHEIIRTARVVGSTVALSYISRTINERSFDHVIVDEASVLRVPEAIIVAMTATNKLTFFGDPKQLPSIVRERSPRTDRWLRPNPFELASIRGTADATGTCVMLREQHRMAPPIRELISRLFYENSLQDGRCPTDGRLILLDTSATPARATTKWIRMNPSKENVVHRGVVSRFIEAIRESDNESTLLVLSPYAAQKRAYEVEANTNRISKVRFATVHTSQGTEADIVILDLVIAPGRGKSRFMNERITPEFRNLMNVAMSRARRQLIIVGHADYITSNYPDGLVHEIVRHVRDRAEWVEVPGTLRVRDSFARAVEGAMSAGVRTANRD